MTGLYLVHVEVIFYVWARQGSFLHSWVAGKRSRTRSVKIFLVLAHLHQFSFPLELSQFLRGVGYLLKSLFLFGLNFLVHCIPVILLIDLLWQKLSIILLHFITPPPLLFLPNITSLLFDLDPIGNQLLFHRISLVERTYVCLSVVTLTVQEHLVVLNY